MEVFFNEKNRWVPMQNTIMEMDMWLYEILYLFCAFVQIDKEK